MYAHSNSETKEFSLRSPAELNYTCLMFIFNLNVSTARTRLDVDHPTLSPVESRCRELQPAEDQPGLQPTVGVERPGLGTAGRVAGGLPGHTARPASHTRPGGGRGGQ